MTGKSKRNYTRLTLLCLVILTLSFASNSYAFDDKREGVFVSFGVGKHTIDLKQYNITKEGWLSTSFVAGYGFNERFLLYLIRDTSWYDKDTLWVASTDRSSYTTETFSVSVTGIGSSVYFSESKRSLYLTSAMGIAELMSPFSDTIETDFGSGLLFGLGYQYSPEFAIEAKMVYTNIGTRFWAFERERTTISPSLSLNYRFF